jgi:uncharacterized Zn-binding protein involved in type VI secretion
MAAPAVVANDKIIGSCPSHLVPGPGGAPITSPAPLPFAAPLTVGLATTVTIGGKFAAVADSGGLNTPPHPGLHPSDPYLSTPQHGKVVKGSGTVTFNGKPAAYSGCQVSCCAGAPAQVTGSAATVQVDQ